MSTAFKFVLLLAAGLVLTGCAAHNYDFAATPNDPDRISQLVEGLDRLKSQENAEEEELYDVSFAPLLHNHLHVFAEVQEEGSPAAFIESEFQTCLPLFAFVNGTVTQYDADQRMLTRNDFDSSLWGAFREEREIVATPVGHRERTRHTVLWLISWWDDEHWHLINDVALSDNLNP